jgi:hypothetical protein
MNSFNIGKAICSILLEDADVVKIVGNKIYPIIADETTTFPFIVYQRGGFVPQSDKDYTDENVTIDMVIASETYSESIDLAIKVRKALEHKESETFGIRDIIIQEATEDYIENTFIQQISFVVYLENN